MNVYVILAWVVDILHWLVVLFWFVGFGISKNQHPRIRKIHGAFALFLFPVQAIFSFKCPLVLLSGYLREIGGVTATNDSFYRPFVITTLKNLFGFTAPDIVITILIIVGSWVSVMTFLCLHRRGGGHQQQRAF